MDTNTVNLDYFPLENNGNGYTGNGFGSTANSDLDNILYSEAPSHSTFDETFSNFKTGLTPSGMNMDAGMGGSFTNNNNMFGAPAFPFPTQQVSPSTIMSPQEATGSSASQMAQQQRSDDISAPEPKRSRQSKKKPLSKAQEGQKREEFLERNRVAASKCRKRKQEQTSNLQENHSRLQLENKMMTSEIRSLEAEIGELRAVLAGHCATATCRNPTDLEAAIAESETTIQINSFAPIQHSRNMSLSGMTDSSQPSYAQINSPNSPAGPKTPQLAEWELHRLSQQQLVRDNEFMKNYDMERQRSDASHSSRMSGVFDTSDSESRGTSHITTPEGDKSKEYDVKPMRNLGNHRPLGPSLGMQGLRGLQNPADYLAERQ